MADLPEYLRIETSPVAPDANQVVGDHYRITVLTPRMLRLEYSPTGRFEDRATPFALHRDLGPVDFRVTRDAAGLHLFTGALVVDYDEGPFSASGLLVRQAGGLGYHSDWRYGVRFRPDKWQQGNLGGTARTLDGVDGALPLEDGLVSTTGYAVLEDTTLPLVDGWVAPRIEGNTDLYYFGYGKDAPGAVRDFYRLTGPQPLLPRWALGNWWSRYYAYSASEYQELVERFEAEQLPFSVAVVDMDWHWVDVDPRFGHGWTGFSWNTDLFPDPPAFLAWLHSHGLRTSLNLHPADGVRAYEDRYAALAGRLGVDADAGDPVNFDIASPEFLVAYFDEVLHPLEDEGVDFWWLDWQQGSYTAVPGLDPLWMLNHFHFLDSARDGKRPLTFSRYAGPGSHRYPVGFSGDTIATWPSLDFQPYFTATAANIGYGWWSHDIGGHCFGYRDDEMVARWFQLGAFSPINRLHSTDDLFAGKEPWKYSADARAAMGDALRLRHRMVPYLYTMAERAHLLGEPLVRPLYWLDPRPEALAARTSFAFGSELLVAPITTPANGETRLGRVSTWLPAGEWVDFFTGVRYTGGRVVDLHRPLSGYPVLARAGGIVPLTWPDDHGTGNPAAIELHVFTGADGDFTLYEDDDAADPRAVTTRFRWSQAERTLTIEPAEGALDLLPAERRYRVLVHGLDAQPVEVDVATATGTTVVVDGEPTKNRVESLIFTLLSAAQIEYEVKGKIWHAIEHETTPARRVAALQSLDLAPALASALLELLLADA
ncbi:MAG: glycoside hydrolase family 31 protein [Propionicimonas sp.]|uniref:glycoside hydrolase family 31 protein n=1 Tax=Propionicimonas sp. TaxID=1955623 RepID=UPI003D0EB980